MNQITWTPQDRRAADREGWNVFHANNGPEIQRDDEAAIFASDAEALAFVEKSNSLHCRKALEFVRQAHEECATEAEPVSRPARHRI